MAVSFAGYSWTQKDSAGAPVSPGPNVFDDANVTVSSGKLHLAIPAPAFTTATAYNAAAPFGYGRYTFTIETDISALDRNVVFGIYTYDATAPEENYRAIDMAVSKFGSSTRVEDMEVSFGSDEPKTWTVIRPGENTVVRFTWLPGSVLYEVFSGDAFSGVWGEAEWNGFSWGVGKPYFRWYGDECVPATGSESLALALWLNDGDDPADGLAQEVIVSDFMFEEMNMYYGDLTLGRLTLTEGFDAAEKSGTGRELQIRGQESWPPLEDSDAVRARGEALLAMDGQITNALFSAKADRNGFYAVKDPGVRFTTFDDVTTKADWEVNLIRLGDTADSVFESRLIGGSRNSAYSASGATVERWHAPPIGHVGYSTGTTQPSLMTRTGEDGAITVYRGIPATANPRWGITPSDFLRGAVSVTVNGEVQAGTTCPNAPTDWSLSNGLIKVEPRTSAGTLRISTWDAASGDWDTAKVWDIKAGTTSLAAVQYVTILRNDPEECIVRLTRTFSPGTTTVDMSLKRGSRFVSFFVQRRDSGTVEVLPNTTEAATDSGDGYIVATSNDAAGNKYVTGSATQMTITTASGSIKNTTAAVNFAFFIGVVVGGTGAASGDTADVIAAQYLGTPAEETRVIRR